jgi:hypothetical protein
MAQRKSPSAPANRPGTKPGKPGSRPTASSGARGPAGRPPTRKPGKSIVNQKQTPWALIATVVVLVLFAAAIVTYAVTRKSSSSSGMSQNPADKTYEQPEVPAAKAISGIIWKIHVTHDHVGGTVKYDASPPMGGAHSPIWANCDGAVYTKQIANENAVHMLEHGAVWITYNPSTIKAADLTKLKSMVDGVDRMALSPYAGLKTPISLQAWNYQLFVQSASDPRVAQFIDALRYNKKVTPEYGALCSGSGFKASQSYPGHPYEG